MAGVLLSWTGGAHANVTFRSVIEIKLRRKSWVESPLESKSSLIPRINFTMVIVFGPSKMTKSRATLPFLMALTAIALYFCYLLVAPFLKPIIFSSILAIIFYPVQARIHRVIRNRHISALLSTAVVILLIILLSFFLGRAIVSGLGEIYQSLRGSGEGRERLTLFI